MIAALVTVLLFAQVPDGIHQARVIVDPPEIPFHKQVTLTVEVLADPELDIVIPPFDPGGLSGLNIYGAPEHVDELVDEAQRRVAVVYTLDAINPGNYPIESAIVKVGDNNFRIPVPAIRVRELTPEEQAEILAMAPNAEPVEVPPRAIAPWMIAIFVAVLAGAGAAYWFLRAKPVRDTGPPPRPAWEVAYDRLRMLDAAALPAAGKFGRYYVELSYIIRRYVEDRYQLHAPERTTPEFLVEATTSGLLTTEQQDQLAALLKLCDRVKFARYASSVEEAEQSMAEILRFIDESIPKTDVASEEEAA